jgi:hypothetical protein
MYVSYMMIHIIRTFLYIIYIYIYHWYIESVTDFYQVQTFDGATTIVAKTDFAAAAKLQVAA